MNKNAEKALINYCTTDGTTRVPNRLRVSVQWVYLWCPVSVSARSYHQTCRFGDLLQDVAFRCVQHFRDVDGGQHFARRFARPPFVAPRMIGASRDGAHDSDAETATQKKKPSELSVVDQAMSRRHNRVIGGHRRRYEWDISGGRTVASAATVWRLCVIRGWKTSRQLRTYAAAVRLTGTSSPITVRHHCRFSSPEVAQLFDVLLHAPEPTKQMSSKGLFTIATRGCASRRRHGGSNEILVLARERRPTHRATRSNETYTLLLLLLLWVTSDNCKSRFLGFHFSLWVSQRRNQRVCGAECEKQDVWATYTHLQLRTGSADDRLIVNNHLYRFPSEVQDFNHAKLWKNLTSIAKKTLYLTDKCCKSDLTNEG